MLKEARKDHAKSVAASIVKGDGWLCEADSSVNDSARRLVEAMAAEHGQAWLGECNGRHPYAKGERPTWLWQWDGQPVCNFGAAFVLPRYDEELDRLIRERDAAEYVGAAEDYVRICVIFARVEAVGGVSLMWT